MFSSSKSHQQKLQERKLMNGASVSVSKIKPLANKVTSVRTKKKLPPSKKLSRANVEVLDSAKVTSKQSLPIVKIESETTHVNVLERIKYVAGISFPEELSKQGSKPFQHLNMEKKLHQPTFQSSVALMEDLDKLKHLEIETKSLLNLKVGNDKKLQNSVNKKVL